MGRTECSRRLELGGDGSTATIGVAPASTAPCTAFRPTPPVPITTTLLPGWTPAVLMTAPTPVITPHASSAALSSGISAGTATACEASMTTCSAKAAGPKALHDRGPVGCAERPVRVERERRLAEHGLVPGARVASSARPDQRHDDVVADGEPLDAGADLGDDPRRFVPVHGRAAGRPRHPGGSGCRSGKSRTQQAQP